MSSSLSLHRYPLTLPPFTSNYRYRDAGLELVEKGQAALVTSSYHKRKLVVAVVGVDSHLVDEVVGKMRFRETYDAAIIGISRPNQRGRPRLRVPRQIATVKLQAGDALLLEASEYFMDSHQFDRYVINSTTNWYLYLTSPTCTTLLGYDDEGVSSSAIQVS